MASINAGGDCVFNGLMLYDQKSRQELNFIIKIAEKWGFCSTFLFFITSKR